MKAHIKTLFAATAILFASCQEEALFNNTTVPKAEFTAETESYDPSTRTALSNSNVLWKQGDQVSIFAASTINEQYQVTDDSDGQTSATLQAVSPSGGFNAGTELSANIAYYPYSSTNAIAKDGTSYSLTVSLPATQTYAAGSFGNGSFPMTAVTSSTADHNLKFKNVLGGIMLQLKGTASIASISITGGGEEILSGTATVTASDTETPAINMTGNGKTVTLDCGTGVQLNAETATSFVIALPPMTMTSGFTVVVADTDGKEMEIKTTKSQTITRSNLLKMPAVNYEGTAVALKHGFVDLGIRKSLLDTRITPDSEYDRKIVIAACNIGADCPEDFGYYFRWGELCGWKIETEKFSPAPIVSAIQYDKDGSETGFGWNESTFSDSYALSDKGWVDVVDVKGKTNLLCDGITYGDAATYNWGWPWVTPDESFLEKFISAIITDGSVTNTISNKNGTITLRYSFVEQNGVNGILVENQSLGKSVFLPAGGYCSLGDLSSGDPYGSVGRLMCSTRGIFTEFYSGGIYTVDLYIIGTTAYPVRPIAELTLSNEIPEPIMLPAVDDVTIDDIDYRTVTVSSSLIDDGNAITERGFYYGTSVTSLDTKVIVSGYSEGDFSKQITGLSAGKTYYIQSYATNEAGAVKSDVVSFTTTSVRGTINGHEWVDLGIRKSDYDSNIVPGSDSDRRVVFASKNIGATSKYDFGYYFRGNELYGWNYTGSKTNRTDLSADNLKQVDSNGNVISTYINCYPGLFDQFDYTESYDIDFHISYTTGDAVSYYYGKGWEYMPQQLAQNLYVTAPQYEIMPSTVVVTARPTSTCLDRILTYEFSSSGMYLENSELGTSVFFPATGDISYDYYNPETSMSYWTQNLGSFETSANCLWIIKDRYGYDWDDYADDYTKWKYGWKVDGSYTHEVYNAIPIRAVAELPL